MPLEPGRYIIINSYTGSLAVLPGNDDRSPLVAEYLGRKRLFKGEKWDIRLHANEKYSIQNVEFQAFAGCDFNPAIDDYVVGKWRSDCDPQLWIIKQFQDVYLISPLSNPDRFWGLRYEEPGTPLAMASEPTNRSNHWTFNLVDDDLPLPYISSNHVRRGLATPEPILINRHLDIWTYIIQQFQSAYRITQVNQTIKEINQESEGEQQSIITHRGASPASGNMIAFYLAGLAIGARIGLFNGIVVTAFLGALLQQVPRPLNMDKSVYIIDVLDRTITLPCDIWETWENVDKYLKFQFKDRAGSRYVDRGDYYIANQDKQLIMPTNWKSTVRPGMRFNMSIVLRQLPNTHKCPHCHKVVTGVSPRDRDIICQFCLFEFHVREDENDPASRILEVEQELISDESETQLFARIHIISIAEQIQAPILTGNTSSALAKALHLASKKLFGESPSWSTPRTTMSSDTDNNIDRLTTISRRKLQATALGDGRASDDLNLHRFVLLKNSVLPADVPTTDVAEAQSNEFEEEINMFDEEAFAFPDASGLVDAHDNNNEAAWLDALLENLAD